MSWKRIKKLLGGFCWGQGVGVEPGFVTRIHTLCWVPKRSSLKTADCAVDSESLNTSICLTCHVFGTVPHFSFGVHADAPGNPSHGSVNTDYEMTFYPTDANTKHLREKKTPFCRLFHRPAVAISCSESGDCSFYYRAPHAQPSNAHSTLDTEGKGRGRAKESGWPLLFQV